MGVSLTTYQDSFNRTFMELKSLMLSNMSFFYIRFNRTFMESKSNSPEEEPRETAF